MAIKDLETKAIKDLKTSSLKTSFFNVYSTETQQIMIKSKQLYESDNFHVIYLYFSNYCKKTVKLCEVYSKFRYFHITSHMSNLI